MVGLLANREKLMDVRVNIKGHEHFIGTDGTNYFFGEIRTDTNGEESKVEKTFHSTIWSILNKILKVKLSKSDASNLRELILEIKDMTSQLKEIQKIFRE